MEFNSNEYYFATAWRVLRNSMELDSIMLFKIIQVVKDKYHMISPISGTLSTKQTNEQNRTKDSGNKEQTDSNQREGEWGIREERRGRGKSRNMNRALMAMENGED